MKADKLVQKFNELTFTQLFQAIENHKDYSDFNTLGLYRALIESSSLTILQKIEIREKATSIFKKQFDFLQLKDPETFIKVSTLGQDLTKADINQLWEDLKVNQQKILKDKKIKHRNFGSYSKHFCGNTDCIYNGLMIKQGSPLAEMNIHFYSDNRNYGKKIKSKILRIERKNVDKIINQALE